MKYLFRTSMLPFVYLLISIGTSLGIGLIDSNLNALKLILCILNIALYVVVVFLDLFHEGGRAVQTRRHNDLTRREIVRTGEDLKLEKGEYSFKNGIFIGLIVSAPLIIALIIHTILHFTTNGEVITSGVVASIVYLIFYEPYFIFIGQSSSAYYFILLYAVPVICAITTVPYYLGARKIIKQNEKLAETYYKIHGEKMQ